MRQIGIDNFKIEIISTHDCSQAESLKHEQKQMMAIPFAKRLNTRYAIGRDPNKTSLAHYYKKKSKKKV